MSSEKKKRGSDKRTCLVRVGVSKFTERSFYNTSIDELVSAADVPKGSFSYYFGDKNKYTVEVIKSYGDYFSKKLDRILLNKSLPPIDRLEKFIDEAAKGMERYDFRRGCLVGNLGQELAALDEGYRSVLLETLRSWQQRVLACLNEAQENGTLSSDIDTAAMAKLFWYAWEGAVLGAKLERSRAPLDLVGSGFISLLRKSNAPACQEPE